MVLLVTLQDDVLGLLLLGDQSVTVTGAATSISGSSLSTPELVGRTALALGYAIGRIGCQLSGDGDYGIASSLPWAMAYPDGTVPTTTEVHPTPVYETLAMGLIALYLWRIRDRVSPATSVCRVITHGSQLPRVDRTWAGPHPNNT